MQKRTLTTLALAASLAVLGGAAGAQAPTTPPTPPAHHGILGRLFHPKPRMAPGMHPGMAPGRPGTMAMAGQIIGNRKTHVYHLPGDPGALPGAANRVYFRTESQALAAGYHHAGASRSRPGGKMHGTRGSLIPMGSRITH